MRFNPSPILNFSHFSFLHAACTKETFNEVDKTVLCLIKGQFWWVYRVRIYKYSTGHSYGVSPHAGHHVMKNAHKNTDLTHICRRSIKFYHVHPERPLIFKNCQMWNILFILSKSLNYPEGQDIFIQNLFRARMLRCISYSFFRDIQELVKFGIELQNWKIKGLVYKI